MFTFRMKISENNRKRMNKVKKIGFSSIAELQYENL